MNFPLLSCNYDDGGFDKDEQGWVTNGTSVSSDATGAVQIRHWGDRNGLDPYDQVTQTRIAAVFPELELVKLEQSPWYFDLAKNRLVSASIGVYLVRRPAQRDLLTAEAIDSAIELVGALVEVLGRTRPVATAFPGWPPRTTDNRYEFTSLKFPLPDGFTLELRHRPAISGGNKPELCVWLDSAATSASVVVTERGECAISVRGALELHPAARALAERWLG